MQLVLQANRVFWLVMHQYFKELFNKEEKMNHNEDNNMAFLPVFSRIIFKQLYKKIIYYQLKIKQMSSFVNKQREMGKLLPKTDRCIHVSGGDENIGHKFI